jgi:hypothetical protein
MDTNNFSDHLAFQFKMINDLSEFNVNSTSSHLKVHFFLNDFKLPNTTFSRNSFQMKLNRGHSNTKRALVSTTL